MMIFKYVLLQKYASNNKKKRIMIFQICVIAKIRIEITNQIFKIHHQFKSIKKKEKTKKNEIWQKYQVIHANWWWLSYSSTIWKLIHVRKKRKISRKTHQKNIHFEWNCKVKSIRLYCMHNDKNLIWIEWISNVFTFWLSYIIQKTNNVKSIFECNI